MAYFELSGGQFPVYSWADPISIEGSALDQLRTLSDLPYIHHHVAVMPDVHAGKGCTIGSVIAMKDAVAPNAVGVDIGCGMMACKTSLTAKDLPDDLARVRSAVEAVIPVGREGHAEPVGGGRALLWHDFDVLAAPVQKQLGKAQKQLGTLGGGNHFIELCLDETDHVWLMLHSGSRGIGNQIAQYHTGIAKVQDYNAAMVDKDLAVLRNGTQELADYLSDLFWAQDYAALNRNVMMIRYLAVLSARLPHLRVTQTVSCHHNYVSGEVHFDDVVYVTRKGAISARLSEWGIIPGSMGTGSYIVQGLGNLDSFESAPHGAGRRMSRTQARKSFTVDHLREQTAGVECRKDAGVIDEIPGAYKDIKTVIDQSSDLVEVKHSLRAVMCIKG